MKFIVNTKPLADSLNLGVINANVSNFYRKSCLAQVTASAHDLKINLEAAYIVSEIRLKGSGDSERSETVFVDSLLLKQLVSTFESSTITLEFTDGGLILHSGKSKFTLPKMVDEVEIQLNAPTLPESVSESVDINKPDWKFVKDNQMYAIAMSFIHPVYTKVWIGSKGDVLVGDFDNSLFTHSNKNKLGTTCLLSDTIINLFNSLPEGAQIIKSDKSYVIDVKTDSYEYLAEFTPQYESDENVGSYNSDIILGLMSRSGDSVSFDASAANKFLSQASLLSNSSDDTVEFSVRGNELSIVDRNVDCKLPIKGEVIEPYKIEFKIELLKSVISKYSDGEVNISPMIDNTAVVGAIFFNDELTTVLAGVE